MPSTSTVRRLPPKPAKNTGTGYRGAHAVDALKLLHNRDRKSAHTRRRLILAPREWHVARDNS